MEFDDSGSMLLSFYRILSDIDFIFYNAYNVYYQALGRRSMDYISVKDVAVKFGINVEKPSDERLSEKPDIEESLSLKELCEELSISIATGRNWIKLGKITPEYTEKRTPYFLKEYVKKLKKDIQLGTNGSLKSRRNKKYVSGNALYSSYVSDKCRNVGQIQFLLQMIQDTDTELSSSLLQLLIADCALKLFLQKNQIGTYNKEYPLLDYLDGRIDIGGCKRLIDDLILDIQAAKNIIIDRPLIFDTQYIYEEKEDILGLLYISCKNMGNRKATGAYYTPTKVVRGLITKLVEKNGTGKNILDPCCGTGNFLIQLPDEFRLEQIYGNDIDEISVKITRLNMALRVADADIDIIYKNITNQNYLSEYEGIAFDFIVGNPPWGYTFADIENEYLRQNYESAVGNNIESYDVFIERALLMLKRNGVLSFVLPEAILNVKSHMPIRQIIASKTSIQYIEFLGNAFDKVQCPCLILQIVNTNEKFSSVGMEVNNGDNNFILNTDRKINPKCFSFTLTDDEYCVINKINEMDNVVYLAGNAAFALGIVTGNNKKYISNIKTSENEMILKGSDIYKYKIKETDNYISFKPEIFQQVAPTEYYRASEKLLYRFICGQLVFAYDDKQTLSLNSCNVLIPTIPKLGIKYILAILNSRVAQFIYKKQFNSVKVLRSHIEQIPIPDISTKEQTKIIKFVDELRNEMSDEKIIGLYDELDALIKNLYGLTDSEYQIIKLAVDGENKFLL